jgi:type I restriction enzyme S subunit
MMPNKKLCEIAKLINGFPFKSEKYVQKGLRVIRIANVQDGYLSDESPCFYPSDFAQQLGDANLCKHDLLMSLTGNVGRVAFIEDEMLPAALNQRVECIRPANEADKDYLYYFFRNRHFVASANSNSHGSAQQNMSTKWLANCLVPYPQETKRQLIVAQCHQLSKALETKKETLELLDHLVKSRFNEMFDALQPNIPFGSVASIVRGASPRPISRFLTDKPEGVNWIKIGDTDSDSIYVTRTSEKVTAQGALKSRHVSPGDFILSNSMSFGRPYILKISGCVHDGWLIVSNYQGSFDPIFLYYLLRSPKIQIQFDAAADGSTVRNLNSDKVKKVLLLVPKKSEQVKFAECAKLIDKSKFVVHSKYFL